MEADAGSVAAIAARPQIAVDIVAQTQVQLFFPIRVLHGSNQLTIDHGNPRHAIVVGMTQGLLDEGIVGQGMELFRVKEEIRRLGADLCVLGHCRYYPWSRWAFFTVVISTERRSSAFRAQREILCPNNTGPR